MKTCIVVLIRSAIMSMHNVYFPGEIIKKKKILFGRKKGHTWSHDKGSLLSVSMLRPLLHDLNGLFLLYRRWKAKL